MVNSKQRGFVIPLGLFLLLGLSISAFAAAKTGLFQEKMAGISVAMQRDFMSAETSIKQQEDVLAALTDMTGQAMIDSECGISEQIATTGGVTIRTTYYNPPPNGYNWGDGDGKKVRLCHKYESNLVISVNAVGTDGKKHTQHEGDYLGICLNASLIVPGDAWVTCAEKYGTAAKRLSWQQLWDI